MKNTATFFPLPVSICCCLLCGAAVPVVSTEITTSPQRQMKGKHTVITKDGKPPCPTLWSPGDSFINTAFKHRSSMHGTWRQRMIDRHTHASRTQASKSNHTLEHGASFSTLGITCVSEQWQLKRSTRCIYAELPCRSILSRLKTISLKILSPTFWRPVVKKIN